MRTKMEPNALAEAAPYRSQMMGRRMRATFQIAAIAVALIAPFATTGRGQTTQQAPSIVPNPSGSGSSSGSSLPQSRLEKLKSRIENNQGLILFFAHPTVSMTKKPTIVVMQDKNVVVDHLTLHPTKACEGDGETDLAFDASSEGPIKIYILNEKCMDTAAFAWMNTLKLFGLDTLLIVIKPKIRLPNVLAGALNHFVKVEDALAYYLTP